ncbi:MAG: GNAT family N-acetyltransferase [Christensenellaceae bacterium]|nr:GNAT family N-acetyltransferase [Christensenellaceae bacterium]
MKLTLETERLILRPFEHDDAEDMFYGWANDDEVTRYLTWNTHKSPEETSKIIDLWISEYEKPERLNFAIVLKETGKLIGGIDVVGYLGGVNGTPVIGYALSRSCWNRGYMTEAATRVIGCLFDKGYEEIRIDAMEENTGSIRVIEKCGGTFIGTEIMARPAKGDKIKVRKYIVRKD